MAGQAARYAAWRGTMLDRANSQTVIPDHTEVLAAHDISPRRTGGLIGQGMALKKTIKRFLAAIEQIDIVTCR